MTLDAAIIERLEDLHAAMAEVRGALTRIEREVELVRRHVLSHGQRLTCLESEQLTPIPHDHGDRGCHG